MAISFNEIPSAWRVPSALVEFDNSQAIQGASTLSYCALLCGQKTAAGTAEALKPVHVTSRERARILFGAGSMLALMAEYFLKNNSITELVCIPCVDDESAVAASGSIAITGTVTAAAPLYVYIGGQAVKCPAAVNTTASALAAALVSAVNAAANLPVTAAAGSGESAGTVTFTAKNKGLCGNDIDLRLSYYDEEKPSGVSFAVTSFSGGAGSPDAADLITAMKDDWYHVIAWPWTDRSSLRALETELEDRWGPLRHIDGVAVCSVAGTHEELMELGGGEDAGNYAHISLLECSASPDLPFCRAAMAAAVTAYYGSIDPARPFQTLTLKGALAPDKTSRLTIAEQNQLLFSGIATTAADAGGNVQIQRLISNYRQNAAGADDESYLDINTLLTLSYLRYDFRARILRKYPRHKLSSDEKVPVGQAIMTPAIGRAEAIAAALDWQELGLVENVDAFKTGLVCERNATDPNRLDWRLTPDLVNQFRVAAVQIQFRLQEAD